MVFSKKKKKEEKLNCLRVGATYAQTAYGHPVVMMPANVGPSKQEVVRFRKPRKRRQTTSRRREMPFDLTKQVIVYFKPDGSGKYDVVGDQFQVTGGVRGHGGGEDESAAEQKSVRPEVNRKGRPKGSKNKSPPPPPLSSSLSFSPTNYRREKRSLTYTFSGHVKCKSCDRTFDGDPVAHCLEYHKCVCPICGRTYRPPLNAHIKSHGTRHVSLTVECYECYACKEKFGDAATMAEHVSREHHSGDDLECPVRCGVAAAFDTAGVVVQHLVDAHCPRRKFSHPTVYRCRVCLAGFKSQINVLRHACNKIKSPHCAQCGKTFPSKMRYAFHLQFHEHPRWTTMHLHCDLCLTEFDDEYQLYDHIRFRHELHDKAVCEVCGRTFKSSMGLNIHRRYHNGSRDFACASCDKSFLNKSTLREHEISHMDVKPFQCHICGQYLSRASRLRSHVKTHRAAESTEQTCYCCSQCGYVAPNPEAVTEHVSKEHPGPRAQDPSVAMELSSVVKCEFCDSTYQDAVHLNDHRDAAHARDVASDAEAFICVVCSSRFSTYSRLTTHKLTHGINMESACGGDRADDPDDRLAADWTPNRFDIPQFFSCQHCNKMCLHYTYYCLHRRLKHPSDVQTYTCDQCAMDFKTSWRLSYHKKTVHGQLASGAEQSAAEKFNCTVCSRQFVKIGALNLHKTRTHIDVSGGVCKYLCYHCGKFFSSDLSLRTHAKTHKIGEVAPPAESGKYHAEDPRSNDSRAGEHAAPTRQIRPRRTYRKSTATTTAVKQSCPYCDQTIDNEAAFIEHVNGHIRCEPAVLPAGTVCELCDTIFGDPVQLKCHLDDHVNANHALLCQFCYFPFLSTAAHDAHVAAECPVATARLGPTAVSPTTLITTTPPPDVQFVGTSTAPIDVRPLIVDCSEIFNKSTVAPIWLPIAPDAASTDFGSPDSSDSSTAPKAVSTDFGSLEPSEPSILPDDASTEFGPLEPSEPSILPDDASTDFGPLQPSEPSILPDDASTEFGPLEPSEPSILPYDASVDDESLETSVIDQLLSILSTPRASAALDTIDFQPPDDMSLDAIFDSITMH